MSIIADPLANFLWDKHRLLDNWDGEYKSYKGDPRHLKYVVEAYKEILEEAPPNVPMEELIAYLKDFNEPAFKISHSREIEPALVGSEVLG